MRRFSQITGIGSLWTQKWFTRLLRVASVQKINEGNPSGTPGLHLQTLPVVPSLVFVPRSCRWPRIVLRFISCLFYGRLSVSNRHYAVRFWNEQYTCRKFTKNDYVPSLLTWYFLCLLSNAHHILCACSLGHCLFFVLQPFACER